MSSKAEQGHLLAYMKLSLPRCACSPPPLRCRRGLPREKWCRGWRSPGDAGQWLMVSAAAALGAITPALGFERQLVLQQAGAVAADPLGRVGNLPACRRKAI